MEVILSRNLGTCLDIGLDHVRVRASMFYTKLNSSKIQIKTEALKLFPNAYPI